MRIFELVLVSLLAFRFGLMFSSQKRWQYWSSIAALGILLLHIGVEGYRWQMIPLYVLTFGNALHALRLRSGQALRLRSTSTESEVRRSNRWIAIGMLILLVLLILPPSLLPIPQTPAPSGTYPVGTYSMVLTDETRTEIYSDQPDEARRIMLQLWYPAEMPANGTPAPWMDNVEIIGPAIAQYLELPNFFLNHIRYSKSHAYTNAVLSNDQDVYPLLLFSHGWNGFRAQNSYQMEELASHGYVVAAADHTYGSVVTAFPDGEVAFNNPAALPSERDMSAEEYRQTAKLLIDQWAGDMSLIIDRLSLQYSGILLGMFSGRLDLDHVGALGHSTGGGAIVEFCQRDVRCAAGLGMDTYLKPVSNATLSCGLQQPFLYMFSETWLKTDNQLLFDELYANSKGENFVMYISGTAHYDFTDLPAFSPLAPALGLKGPLNGDRVLEIINAYSLAFFDQYLRGENSDLLKGPSNEFPEVEFSQK